MHGPPPKASALDGGMNTGATTRHKEMDQEETHIMDTDVEAMPRLQLTFKVDTTASKKEIETKLYKHLHFLHTQPKDDGTQALEQYCITQYFTSVYRPIKITRKTNVNKGYPTLSEEEASSLRTQIFSNQQYHSQGSGANYSQTDRQNVLFAAFIGMVVYTHPTNKDQRSTKPTKNAKSMGSAR